jgi:hypothetical protein
MRVLFVPPASGLSPRTRNVSSARSSSAGSGKGIALRLDREHWTESMIQVLARSGCENIFKANLSHEKGEI